MPFYLAITHVELAELLEAAGRMAEAEPLLAEARTVLERLGATPWLERLDVRDTAVVQPVSG